MVFLLIHGVHNKSQKKEISVMETLPSRSKVNKFFFSSDTSSVLRSSIHANMADYANCAKCNKTVGLAMFKVARSFSKCFKKAILKKIF